MHQHSRLGSGLIERTILKAGPEHVPQLVEQAQTLGSTPQYLAKNKNVILSLYPSEVRLGNEDMFL